MLGGGALVIFTASFGMISGRELQTDKVPFALIIANLVITSGILIVGLNGWGIVDLFSSCRTMTDPVFSSPWLFVLLVLVNAGITMGINAVFWALGQKNNCDTPFFAAAQHNTFVNENRTNFSLHQRRDLGCISAMHLSPGCGTCLHT
jgi:hypothetical protein